jgi:hypothetical protein
MPTPARRTSHNEQGDPVASCQSRCSLSCPTCQIPPRAFCRGYQNRTFSLRGCAREPHTAARHGGQGHYLENVEDLGGNEQVADRVPFWSTRLRFSKAHRLPSSVPSMCVGYQMPTFSLRAGRSRAIHPCQVRQRLFFLCECVQFSIDFEFALDEIRAEPGQRPTASRFWSTRLRFSKKSQSPASSSR